MNKQSGLLVVTGIILAGAFLRLIPHWPNFTPIAAIALLGGTYIKRKDVAFAIPVAAMLLSDLIIGFHSTMIAVYASFMLIVSLGFILRKKPVLLNVISASMVSSTLFYLVTNFASWKSGLMPYAQDVTGLMQSYLMGLPFFFNGIIGDLFYCGIFFGAYYIIVTRKQAAINA